MVFCPSCGADAGDAKFCSNCGASINVDTKKTKYCSNCGNEIDINAEICPKCGVRQFSVNQISSSEKNVWIAVVLSLLIVGLGHFYLGLPKKGALLLIITIICWALIAVFIGFILYPLVLIYGVYDVYKSAVAISEGKHVEDELF